MQRERYDWFWTCLVAISDADCLALECSSAYTFQECHRCTQRGNNCGHSSLDLSRYIDIGVYVLLLLALRPSYSPSISDGAARVGATVFGELLSAIFANVGQRAVRKVARETFEHLMNLDLKFHLSRQTGGLTRAIDRGTRFLFHFSFRLLGISLMTQTEELHTFLVRSCSELSQHRSKLGWSVGFW